MPFQHKRRIPQSAVLRGELESLNPVSDVDSKFIHALKRDGDFANRVLRLRRLNLAALNGLTNAMHSPVLADVTNSKSAQFSFEVGPS